MIHYQNSKEEQEFLKHYNIANYERPSVATDMAIYSIMDEGEQDNFRKLPQKALKLLLIKRASHPFREHWALPGGFCRPDEDVYETARRELYEETNVKDAYLNLAGIFGDVGRDPRGWIISNTFLALIDGATCNLRAGTDAWEAKWFSVQFERTELRKEIVEDTMTVESEYVIDLQHEETGICLHAKLREYKSFERYHETVRYEIIESRGLAFDHAKLILYTLLFLRKNVQNDLKIVFDLMPETFTLTQLQHAFEVILGEKLLTANFRRKMNEYVIETEQIVEGAGHRPAKLFRRNVENFISI